MIVISGQSLSDVAVQQDGTIESLFEWALKNDKSITDKLTPGEKLVSPNSELKNQGISEFFSGIQKSIATGLTNEQLAVVIPDDGIGAMIIEETFIIR